MQPNTNTLDAVARLLATENISVVRAAVKTAYFDLAKRTLVLPRWQNMTPELEEMLILHEVGRALFTTEDYMTACSAEPHMRSYFNIVEDARIEAAMKRRYPGSRKSFNRGYTTLRERDFFGIAGRDLESLLPIDRLNLYFKLGMSAGIKLNDAERAFANRMDRCVLESEGFQIAREIYAYSKLVKQDKQKEMEQFLQQMAAEEPEPEDDDYYDLGDSDPADPDDDPEESDAQDVTDDVTDESDTDDSDEAEGDGKDSTKSDTKEEPETSESKPSDSGSEAKTDAEEDEPPMQLDSELQGNLDQKLESLADTEIETHYFNPEFNRVIARDPIIPVKEVIRQFRESSYHSALAKLPEEDKTYIADFKTNSTRVVNYLVKEFEMRKAATNYKRARVAKTGQLDSRKLFAYKIKEDLFRQVMRTADGKNHGMLFLLDWSGSMSDSIRETLEQIINLAMFCTRVGVRYQVLAFTDGYDKRTPYVGDAAQPNVNEKGLGTNYDFHLLELFSSKMTLSEFNLMVTATLSGYFRSVSQFTLHGTPLNESLLYLTKYTGEFIKQNNVEKCSLIVLTDGEGSALVNHAKNIANTSTYDYKTGKYKIINRFVMQDPITKKEYDLSNNAGQQTGMLLQMIKDRFNVNVIRIFVCSPVMYSAQRFVAANMNLHANRRVAYHVTMKETCRSLITDLRGKGFKIIENMPGCDEMYLLSSRTKTTFDYADVNSTMTASQIARKFKESMKTSRTSRVVLDRFIDTIA